MTKNTKKGAKQTVQVQVLTEDEEGWPIKDEVPSPLRGSMVLKMNSIMELQIDLSYWVKADGLGCIPTSQSDHLPYC